MYIHPKATYTSLWSLWPLVRTWLTCREFKVLPDMDLMTLNFTHTYFFLDLECRNTKCWFCIYKCTWILKYLVIFVCCLKCTYLDLLVSPLRNIIVKYCVIFVVFIIGDKSPYHKDCQIYIRCWSYYDNCRWVPFIRNMTVRSSYVHAWITWRWSFSRLHFILICQMLWCFLVMFASHFCLSSKVSFFTYLLYVGCCFTSLSTIFQTSLWRQTDVQKKKFILRSSSNAVDIS